MIARLLQPGVQQVLEGAILVQHHNPSHTTFLHAVSRDEESCATVSSRPVSREVVCGLKQCVVDKAMAMMLAWGAKRFFFTELTPCIFGELDSWKSCLMCALPALRGLTL